MLVKVLNHWFHWKPIVAALFDLAFIFAVVILGVRWINTGLPLDLRYVAIYALLLALTMLALNTWLGFYHRNQKRTWFQTRARAVLSLYLSIPLAYLLFIALPFAEASREFMELTSMGAVFGMLLNRLRVVHTNNKQETIHRVLVFGTGEKALAVQQALTRSDPTAKVIGFYPSPVPGILCVPADQVIEPKLPLADTAQALKADEIVIALNERRGGTMPLRELLDCRLTGIGVMDLANYFEQTLGQIRLDALRASWLIFGEGFSQGFWRTTSKRVFDIVCAALMLLLTLPVMIITAILIVIEDGWPFLYLQERVGLNGRVFKVIKFRSMRRDAESDGRPRWAKAGDDRITRVGRFIRKSRIDELPQLWNVLVGDMSMVGPRPERPYFVDQLTREIPFYALRHSVKPGVTGWAQVRYHYGASVDDAAEKLQYDLFYVKNHSLFLDTIIIFETVGVVVNGSGAH